MTNTKKLAEAAQNEVAHVPGNHQCAYSNGMALRQLLAEKEAGFHFNLQTHPAPQPLHIPRCVGHVFNYLKSDSADEFLRIKMALEISEASPAFQAACKILDPLVAEVRRLEALILDEQTASGQKLAAIREAEDAAIAKAQAALESDPAVKKLKEQAEQTRPAHIEAPSFRGKVVLATATAQ